MGYEIHNINRKYDEIKPFYRNIYIIKTTVLKKIKYIYENIWYKILSIISIYI